MSRALILSHKDRRHKGNRVGLALQDPVTIVAPQLDASGIPKALDRRRGIIRRFDLLSDLTSISIAVGLTILLLFHGGIAPGLNALALAALIILAAAALSFL